MGRTYRALPASFVAEIDLVGRRIVLRPQGKDELEAAPTVSPAQTAAEGSRLVRFVPRDLDRLVTTTGRAQSPSRLWAVAVGAVACAAVLILPVDLLVEKGVGGGLRWAWIALPLLFLGAAACAAAAAADADRGEKIPFREKLAAVWSFLLGISPRRPSRR